MLVHRRLLPSNFDRLYITSRCLYLLRSGRMTYHALYDLQKFLDHHSNSLVTQQASHASKMNVADKVTVKWSDGVKHRVLKLKNENNKINPPSSTFTPDLPSHLNSWYHTGVSLHAPLSEARPNRKIRRSTTENRKMSAIRYCAVLKFPA